jgi:hypothetical protein
VILLGINGGMRQGKSTVGAELRRLAGVDAKADLEFSYPVGQVANLWVKQWAPSVIDSGLPVIEIANKLMPLVVEPVKAVTSFDVDPSKLLIENTPESLEESNRLLSYLEKYIEAGSNREDEFPVPITPDNKVLHRALYQWIGARMIDEVEPRDGQVIWPAVIEHRIQTLIKREYPLVTVGGARYPHDQAMIHANGGLIIQVSRPGIANDSDITERAGDGVEPDIKVINDGTLDELNTVVGQLYSDLLAGKPQSKYTAA